MKSAPFRIELRLENLIVKHVKFLIFIVTSRPGFPFAHDRFRNKANICHISNFIDLSSVTWNRARHSLGKDLTFVRYDPIILIQLSKYLISIYVIIMSGNSEQKNKIKIIMITINGAIADKSSVLVSSLTHLNAIFPFWKLVAKKNCVRHFKISNVMNYSESQFVWEMIALDWDNKKMNFIHLVLQHIIYCIFLRRIKILKLWQYSVYVTICNANKLFQKSPNLFIFNEKYWNNELHHWTL